MTTTDATVADDFTGFDDNPTDQIDVNEATTRKQNSLKHMLGTFWFWMFFTVVLVTALVVRLYQAGKDAYTGDWSFSRSMSAFPAMFGGVGSLLGCLLILIGCAGYIVFIVWMNTKKKPQPVLAAFIGLGLIILGAIVGIAWVRIDFSTALGFVISLVAIFAAVILAGLAVVNCKFYIVPDRKVKTETVPDTTDDIA